MPEIPEGADPEQLQAKNSNTYDEAEQVGDIYVPEIGSEEELA
ncbi:MAG: hypothetical protein AB7L84_06555 [Acidimicrobiia bacterium]